VLNLYMVGHIYAQHQLPHLNDTMSNCADTSVYNIPETVHTAVGWRTEE